MNMFVKGQRCPKCGGKLAIANMLDRHRNATDKPMLVKGWRPVEVSSMPDHGVACYDCGTGYHVCSVLDSNKEGRLIKCACGAYFDGRVPLHIEGQTNEITLP